MAVCGGVHGGYFPSKFGKLSAKLSSQERAIKQSLPPVFISTNPTHVNPLHFRDLYILSNHSVHRFPNRDSDGRVEPVEVNKLRIAISHSSAVVSVFTKLGFDSNPPPESEISNLTGIGGDWIQRLMPLSPANDRLVGFGRAVSDAGLTASIYDVMVIPALQGRGIGRMIVRRIIRMLTNRSIYDIAALCHGEERLFFKACEFGNDMLESTTMMHTKTGSNSQSGQLIRHGGRKLLLVLPGPPVREPFQSWYEHVFRWCVIQLKFVNANTRISLVFWGKKSFNFDVHLDIRNPFTFEKRRD